MTAFATSTHASSAHASSSHGRKNLNSARTAAILLLALILSLVGISCTTISKEVSTRGIFDQFEQTPQVIMRVEGMFLRDFVDSLNDDTIQALMMRINTQASEQQIRKPINRSRIDSTLSRTHVAAIGLTWKDRKTVSFEATLAGNFARIPTALSFALDSSWKRIPGGYAAKTGALHVRDPQAGKLHVSSFPFQMAGAGTGAGARVLAEQSGLLASDASFDMYIDAKSAVVSKLPILDGITLPFDGIRVIAMRDGTSPTVGAADAVYLARIRIQMKDEQTARTFRPIMKLVWALLSAQISSMGLPIPPETGIEQKGSSFETQTFPVQARDIVEILASALNLV